MPSKSSSHVLTDHDEIRRWAEERGAKPAAVRNTGNDNDDVGIIRLDFPGYSGEGSLQEIEWDEWFESFEDNDLALVVQEKTANGQTSNFNKLVSRENALASSGGSDEGSNRSKGTSQRSNAKNSSKQTSSSKGRSSSGTGGKTTGRRSSKSQAVRSSSKSSHRKDAA